LGIIETIPEDETMIFIRAGHVNLILLIVKNFFGATTINGTDVTALASSANLSSRKNSLQNSRWGNGGGGFANSPKRGKKTCDSEDDEVAKRSISNLFSVCVHIQNPDLYQPIWADACHQVENNEGQKVLLASKDVTKGQILTLFPIHALGLRWIRKSGHTEGNAEQKGEKEFVAFDNDRKEDAAFFTSEPQAGLRMRLNIPLDDRQPVAAKIGRKNKILFAMLDPSREVLPGWLGGRTKLVSNINPTSSVTPLFGGNCVTMPLPGAAPLCAVVAIKDITKGQELVQGLKAPEKKVLNECKDILSNEYQLEISELKSFIEMACASREETENEAAESNFQSTLGPFHTINQQYPGLRQLHEDPDIYAVDQFLSEKECSSIISKASLHLKPCLVKNEFTGAVEKDLSRTSTNTNLPQSEAPTIVSKLSSLISCEVNRLEILQVLRYTRGQEFRPHTDGFEGPTSACGFEKSNRLVTVFCYLNDVEKGGSTYFPAIDLDIKPKQGMAVIHFPSDVTLFGDERTLHQGMHAIDDKWLLTTWAWSKPRTDPLYDEKQLIQLNSDVI